MKGFDMDRKRHSVFALCTGLIILFQLFIALPISADIRLPNIIGSSMVVQRDIPLLIWGWADPGEKVSVKMGNSEVSVKADKEGKWMVRLPSIKTGGPYEMTLSGKNTLKLTDILAGEVWVCSGQSNMVWRMAQVNNSEQEISDARYPNIRLFQVPRTTSGIPAEDVNAAWKACSPGNISQFSAVAYFFGRKLHNKLNVPIGLIETAWGGTRIEPWTPPVGFQLVDGFDDIILQITDADVEYRKKILESIGSANSWIKTTKKSLKSNKPFPVPPEWPKHRLDSHIQPTGLYNGMVHPLVPFGIRGAIWYQGESNLVDGMLYREKMKALIHGWRTVWNQGEFPFYFVQLAPYRYRGKNWDAHNLPRMWEAQTKALSVFNTGMASAIDIGNVTDIHPRNKQDVGKRLALWALAKTYGFKSLVYSGPMYKSMSIEDNKIRITFNHNGGGLESRDGNPLTWFEIAGADNKYVSAHAEIAGESILVWSDSIQNPAHVRFAWHEEAEPNLMNKEGLPALTFRTDTDDK